MLFKTKAPGSLMLLGEYAVLSGKPAIVGAINRFITVTLKPRRDNLIRINSILGKYTTHIDALEPVSPFEYVLTALSLPKKLPSGCDIKIQSEFSSKMGLGSSAAVTVAMVAAIDLWLKKKFASPTHLWKNAKRVIDRVQQKGSGADLAASIYGGVILFQNNPLKITRLCDTLPICAIYSGKKTKTVAAIDYVQQRRQQQPNFFRVLEEASEQLTRSAVNVIKSKNWQTLGHLFDLAQGLLHTYGVSNEKLNTLIKNLRKQPGIFGAKISGAGLGDCVIGLGKPRKKRGLLKVSIGRKGVSILDQ